MYLQTLIRVSGNFLVKHIHYHSGEWKYLEFNNGIHYKAFGTEFWFRAADVELQALYQPS